MVYGTSIPEKNPSLLLFASSGSCSGELHRLWRGHAGVALVTFPTDDYIRMWIIVGVLLRNGMDMETDEIEMAVYISKNALQVWMVHCIGWVWNGYA
jgi:hypothetical protein